MLVLVGVLQTLLLFYLSDKKTKAIAQRDPFVRNQPMIMLNNPAFGFGEIRKRLPCSHVLTAIKEGIL